MDFHNILDSYAYDEFGADLTGNQATTQPFGYTGHSFDGVAGTYFAQLRNFDPAIGRFTSEDPIKADANWYSYCDSNPLVFVDPLGLASTPSVAPLASRVSNTTASGLSRAKVATSAAGAASKAKTGANGNISTSANTNISNLTSIDNWQTPTIQTPLPPDYKMRPVDPDEMNAGFWQFETGALFTIVGYYSIGTPPGMVAFVGGLGDMAFGTAKGLDSLGFSNNDTSTKDKIDKVSSVWDFFTTNSTSAK